MMDRFEMHKAIFSEFTRAARIARLNRFHISANCLLALALFIFASVSSPAHAMKIEECSDLPEIRENLKKGDYDSARAILEKKLGEATQENSDLLMDIAGCYFNMGQFSQAEKLVGKAIKIESSESDRYCPVEKIFNLAECMYFQRRFDEAIQCYNQALEKIEPYEEARLRRKLFMSLASCHSALGHFKKAKLFQEKAVHTDREIYSDTDINYGWGLLKLSDIYRKLHDKRSDDLFRKAIWIFRNDNRTRILKEKNIDPVATDKRSVELRHRVDQYIFGNRLRTDCKDADAFLFSNKAEKSERTSLGAHPYKCSLWNNQYENTEAPGIVWLDPEKPFHGIIIAVHGLGLHHGAYESFGRKIASEGFVTIAFDVRGFGSYLESKGSERLDMNACVQDLNRLVKCISSDYPDKAIFLLGESMGGAIVLRLGAEDQDLVTGIICSVPSGSRYEPAFTKVKVGLNYLKNKNGLVDMSPYVVRQATKSKSLRSKWKQDPASRLRLSPKELLEFRSFMNKNAEVARKIDRLPVLIFQGDEDRLVKSKGTYDLFEAVKSRDKTMVVVGGTEHLIFESGQFKNGITLGVVGWMFAHAQHAGKKTGHIFAGMQ